MLHKSPRRHNFNKKISGFNIIELVLVLVVIGIIAALIVPKFINIGNESEVAATQTVASALNSSSANNALASKTGESTAVSVTNCTNISSTLPGSNPLPSGYTITSQSISSGARVTCTVTNPDGVTTATFIGRGT